MNAPISTLYLAPGKYSKPLRDFLTGFNYEYKNLKPGPSQYERTTKGYFEDLNTERLRLLNAKRGEARRLKENYEYAKSGIEKKRESIFFPKSNSYNESEKQTATLQRQLAITRLSSGSIDKEAFAKEIDSNFKSGNVDYNGEVYNYLINDKRIPNETKFSLIGKLKDGFNSRGLSELNELQQDLSNGEDAYNEIKKTFQLG